MALDIFACQGESVILKKKKEKQIQQFIWE